jgi:hypothetical protein
MIGKSDDARPDRDQRRCQKLVGLRLDQCVPCGVEEGAEKDRDEDKAGQGSSWGGRAGILYKRPAGTCLRLLPSPAAKD